MIIHYAIAVFTDSPLSDSTYGFVDGVFRFVTANPYYEGGVIPKYGNNEIDPITGADVGGDNIIDWFCSGWILKEGITGNPARTIDIISAGNYSTNSSFSFKLRNDVKFWNFLQDPLNTGGYDPANAIHLTGRMAVLWAVLDDVFYLIGKGKIANNPYTESEYLFNVNDDAELIHKNFPPHTTPYNTADSEESQQKQGEVIPVVFGNNVHSKIVKNNEDNYILPLNTPYLPAAATSYTTLVTPQSYYLTLYSSTVFSDNDTRLVGKYLYVVAATLSQQDALVDRIYKILSNTASTVGHLVKIKIDSPLVRSSSSDSSEDVLMDPSEFNYPSWHHCLTGTPPNYVSTYDTWWFQISNYMRKAFVSDKEVIVEDVLQYNQDTHLYSSASSLLRYSATANPTIELIANTGAKDGKTTQYEDIDLPMIGYGTQLYATQWDYFTSLSDIALVTDRDRATNKRMIINASNLDFSIFANYAPQSIPAKQNQILNGDYSSLYFCVDLMIDISTGFFYKGLRLKELKWTVTDVNGSTYGGSTGPAVDHAYAVHISIGMNNINFAPNNIMIAGGGTDSKTYFNERAQTDGKTYKFILKIPDLSPSIFTSPQIKQVRLEIKLEHPDFFVDGNVYIKEIAIIGERTVDTIKGDLFAKSKGETVANDGITFANSVYKAIKHILQDFDGIPAALIDYGDLATTRDLGSGNSWPICRTVTEQKNSVEYLNELCQHSFVAMFTGRTGKRVLRSFGDPGVALVVTTGAGKTPNHNGDLIVRDSISDFSKTDTSQLFNGFYLQYAYDAGEQKYVRGFNIANLGVGATFPAAATLNPDGSGNPYWWAFVSGLETSSENPTINYSEAKAIWEKCQESFDKNKAIKQVQGDISELPWFSDSQIYDPNDATGSSALCSAFLLLQRLVSWATLQKDVAKYSIPLNADTIETELLDVVRFNDVLYTNGKNRLGYITGIEYDAATDQIKIEGLLQPLETIVENLIYEVGPLMTSDTITESGSQPDTITETGV